MVTSKTLYSSFNVSGIYCILNTYNNKRYIGKGKNIKIRIIDHKSCLRNGNHRNKHLQDSWNIYGEGCFDFMILETLENYNENDASELEKSFIKKYRSNERDFGYNFTIGGDGVSGNIISDETRKRMSESHIGKVHSEETRKKISQSNVGRTNSPETRLKLSKALRGRIRSPMSEETKIKISESQKGKKISKETRKKLSEINTGKKHTLETREKMSNSKKGMVSPNKGKKTSEETKKKLSLAMKEFFKNKKKEG